MARAQGREEGRIRALGLDLKEFGFTMERSHVEWYIVMDWRRWICSAVKSGTNRKSQLGYTVRFLLLHTARWLEVG